jgi:hypothetical protein
MFLTGVLIIVVAATLGLGIGNFLGKNIVLEN